MVIGRPLFGIYVYDAEGFYNSEDEVPVYYDIWGNKKYFGGVSCASPMSGKVGTYKIKDLNGDNMINGSDMYYAGTPQPKAHGDGLTRSVGKLRFEYVVQLRVGA